jgi:hypothetical protein
MFTNYSRSLSPYLSILVPLIFSACSRLENVPGRKFQIINLSLPRSATVSFAGLFADFHPTHEFDIHETLNHLFAYSANRITKEQMMNFLLRRDRAAGHWVDSSSFFSIEPEIVYETFPDAKYFFVLRRCDTWIASMADRMRLLFKMRKSGAGKDLRFLEPLAQHFSPYLHEEILLNDRVLRQNAVPLIESLSIAWRVHTLRALQAMARMPPSQRLVLLLEDFDNSMRTIAQFAGVDLKQIKVENRHMNADTHLEQIYSLLGKDRVSIYGMRQRRIVDHWLAENPELLYRPTRRLVRRKGKPITLPQVRSG